MNNPDVGNGMILQKFKVQVLTAALHSFTIVATSPEEAVNKVMSGQSGAEAGREGPSPIAFNVTPVGVIDADAHITLQRAIEKFIVDTVSQNKARQAQGIPPAPLHSLIQVVTE